MPFRFCPTEWKKKSNSKPWKYLGMSESSIFAENPVMRDQISQEGLLKSVKARLTGAVASEDSLPSLEGWSEAALGSLGKGKWVAGSQP